MVFTSRRILALGLGLAAAALFVAPSLVRGQGDSTVRQTATNTTEPVKPPPPVAPIVGTVDIEAVFKDYDKTKAMKKEIEAKVMARKADLMKTMQLAQQEAEMLQKMTPGSEDYRAHEKKAMEYKASYETQRELAQTEAEMFATMYKEVQMLVASVAKWRGMNYVVRVSNRPVTGNDPDSVMAAMNNLMVYSDPRNDITRDVVYNLNNYYRRTLSSPSDSTGATKPATGRAPAAAAGAGMPTQR
jgi:outer membrane protein